MISFYLHEAGDAEIRMLLGHTVISADLKNMPRRISEQIIDLQSLKPGVSFFIPFLRTAKDR